ncbi:MAG: GGDEF domain-containing protein, partial [Rhodocyclaceae bacterium]|nr:GGDEF domain-containing protein [Rhodocyclaceae bacterium]
LVLAGLSRGRQREEAHLRSVAETDALTGISNRFALFAREQARLRDPQRAPFALLHMDLDHFKEINDRYGHSVGDAALIAFADVCRGVVRHASDTLARIGGDEFVIVLHELQDPGTEAAAVADRIRTLLQEPLDLLGHKLALKVSVGVAVAHGPVELEAFLHQADVALLDAKKDRGSRHTLFERNLHGNLIHELEEALGAG